VFDVAWCEGAAVWLECDDLPSSLEPAARDRLALALRMSPVHVLLTGTRAWRPAGLLERGRYLEIDLPTVDAAERARRWTALVPSLSPRDAESLGVRFHVGWSEMRAAARLASVEMTAIAETDAPLALARACSLVARRQSEQLADVIQPRRGPDQLVLPAPLHAQVLEVADFYLASPRVYEDWGFARITTGGGVKAFFTGEPGTGKTLAAEVVAHRVGLPLLRVDLSRLVSKWIGETEKHLDTVFTEAERGHYVLLLDECDALGGKRGEIHRGSDKFANIETAYLLQRLEAFRGIAILASNLEDQIDQALMRRFHVVLHFPPPALAERVRLWRLAFSTGSPLPPEIDLQELAALELTGAAIVNAATAAAMLAASSHSAAVTADHVIGGVVRQFQRESRILTSSQLARLRVRPRVESCA
jgi:hypothetical protein